MGCRINKRRIWAHRLRLEASQHDDNCFVTLTYSDQRIPDDASVRPAVLSGFLKRFRRRIEPVRIRFFGVGEYGDLNFRPHYHVAVFGWPKCQSLRLVRGKWVSCNVCASCAPVVGSWGEGFVSVLPLEGSSTDYVCGYVVKKMTDRSDPRLEGRHPEFAQPSLKPGIAAYAMWEVASELLRYDADIPYSLGSGGNHHAPLGRFLRQKLKEYTGKFDDPQPEALEKLAKYMQSVREYAFANDRSVASVLEELNGDVEAVLEKRSRKRETL